MNIYLERDPMPEIHVLYLLSVLLSQAFPTDFTILGFSASYIDTPVRKLDHCKLLHFFGACT